MQADIKFKCVTTAPSAGGVQQLSARLIILHSWYQQGCFQTTAADIQVNVAVLCGGTSVGGLTSERLARSGKLLHYQRLQQITLTFLHPSALYLLTLLNQNLLFFPSSSSSPAIPSLTLTCFVFCVFLLQVESKQRFKTKRENSEYK